MSKRPIVFFDLETTGKSSNPDKVRIIEISARKVDPDTLEQIGETYHKYCNNGDVPIDPDAYERHGIKEKDLVGQPTFQEIAKEVYDYFDGCDVGGYFCSVFDIPILYYSFIRAGLSWDYKNVKNYDIYTLYRKFHSGKLCDVYKSYTGKDLENAHEADADIMATIDVYREMKKKSEEFDDSDLDYYSENLDVMGNFKVRVNESGKKEIYIDFGKYKGTSVDKIDKSYFKWICESDFAPDVKHYAKKIYSML